MNIEYAQTKGKMMLTKHDLTGKRFGKLVALSVFDSIEKYGRRWLCLCDCGENSVHLGSNLRSGQVKSCGCMAIKALEDRISRVREKRAEPFLGGSK